MDAWLEGDVIPRLMMLHRMRSDAESSMPSERTLERIGRQGRTALLERAGLLPHGAMVDRPASGVAAGTIAGQKVGPRTSRSKPRIDQRHILELIDTARHDPLSECVRYCMTLHERGHSMDQIYCDLITPAARRLGELWTGDDLDFVEVTLAAGRLQRTVQCLRRSEDNHEAVGEAFLLTAAPGEQHTLGLHLAAEQLRAAGLDVVTLIAADPAQIERVLRRRRFAYLGISAGSHSMLESVTSLIGRARSAAKSNQFRVLVGGAAVVQDPHINRAGLGADCVAVDLRQAIAFVVRCREEQSIPPPNA